jgi:hypothetical protein
VRTPIRYRVTDARPGGGVRTRMPVRARGGAHPPAGPMPVNYWTLKPRLYAPVPEVATTTYR